MQNWLHLVDQAGNYRGSQVVYPASLEAPRARNARFSVRKRYCVQFSMPNTPSAQKYLKQSTVRRLRNRQDRSALRTRLKNFRALLATSPSREDADKQFALVSKALDQAAAKNLIHANAAARTKSRLAALQKKSCS